MREIHSRISFIHWGWDKGCHFPDDIFKCIFANENIWISIKNRQKFIPKGTIHNISALVQILTWCCPGGNPLSEPMGVRILTQICVTRPQWVNAGEQNGHNFSHDRFTCVFFFKDIFILEFKSLESWSWLLDFIGRRQWFRWWLVPKTLPEPGVTDFNDVCIHHQGPF